MGFFAAYLYDGRRWLPYDPDDAPGVSERWFAVDIYDSDITTITYAPTGAGTGVAYLGNTPRSYFDDDEASDPTDTHREAAGLASW